MSERLSALGAGHITQAVLALTPILPQSITEYCEYY
jgi:hypothetical protein